MAGVSLEQLGAEVIQHARVLMEAHKTKYFAHQGLVGDERQVEDNATRLGATRLVAEIAGVISSRTDGGPGSIQVNVIVPPFAQVQAIQKNQ